MVESPTAGIIRAMTERGVPIVDGAPACPFVALEDDRDARSTSPDHRHRCFAEVRPAPRALAHQEAYCLSSAFPVCPTFQDWARREAAKAQVEGVPESPSEETPHRNPPRDWASPPPWLAGRSDRSEAGPGPARPDAGEGEEGEDAEVVPIPPRGGGLAGGFAERLLGSSEEPDPGAAPRREATPPSGGGAPRRPSPRDEDEDWMAEDESGEEEPASVAPVARRPGIGRRDRDLARDRGRGPDRRPAVSDSRAGQEPSAPPWERPRRLEAYPTIRSRRMPSLSIAGSPILLGIAAILIAAVALFFLPALLGIGNPPGPTQSPSPTGGSSAAPTTVAEPTPTPLPTQQAYVVQVGDTMSKIATRFGIPLQTLIDANKDTIPNPDVLKPGDEVIIPVAAPTTIPAASEVTSAPSP